MSSAPHRFSALLFNAGIVPANTDPEFCLYPEIRSKRFSVVLCHLVCFPSLLSASRHSLWPIRYVLPALPILMVTAGATKITLPALFQQATPLALQMLQWVLMAGVMRMAEAVAFPLHPAVRVQAQLTVRLAAVLL